MKILARNVHVRAFDGAFEMLPKVLYAVRVAVEKDILVFAVFHGFMRIASRSERAIRKMLIGVAGWNPFECWRR
jgi:hypothetical protein